MLIILYDKNSIYNKADLKSSLNECLWNAIFKSLHSEGLAYFKLTDQYCIGQAIFFFERRRRKCEI